MAGTIGPRPRTSATLPAQRSRYGEIGSGPSHLSNDEEFPTLGNRAPTIPASRPWGQNIGGQNIWNTESLQPRGIRRDMSITRNDRKDDDTGEAKQGSGALLDSSENDGWNGRSRSAWGHADTNGSGLGQGRGTGVSPPRSLAHNLIPNSHAEPAAGTQPFYPAQRQGSLSHTLNPTGHHSLNPASNTFAIPRQSNAISQNGLGPNGHLSTAVDNLTQNLQHMQPWTGTSTLQSPAEDRRGLMSSDYNGTHSNTASRSGSLPPSRHGQGNDPAQYPRHSETYPNPNFMPSNMQPLARTHATFPQTRSYAERSGSIQSDVALFSRGHQLEDDATDSPSRHYSHRPSASVSGISAPSSNGLAESRQGHDTSSMSNEFSYQNYNGTQDVPHQFQANGNTFAGPGGATPEDFPNSHMAEQQLRNFQFNSRNSITPINGDARHSPFWQAGMNPQYSTGATPPFDHLYPSRGEYNRTPSRQANINPNLLDQRLRNVQQQQDPRLLPSGYPPMMGPNSHLRQPYQYQYNVSNMMLQPNLAMPGLQGMAPAMEPPRGPRDQVEPCRSQLLEEFKASKRKMELKEIFGHIIDFAGDQGGSRLLQGRLETANSDEKERAFQELKPNFLQLMTDVFGNYVIQKFFEHGDQNQKRQLADRLKGHVLQFSTQMYGCRVVQKALEQVLVEQQASLVAELKGNVIRCVKDSNGNHVIQKAVERVPAEHIQFIVDDFRGQCSSLATHPYGCRVIQRMIEFCEPEVRDGIIKELSEQTQVHVVDQYGNYVVQHMITHGNEADRERVFALVQERLLTYSTHKFASNVVEKALIYGTKEYRRSIMLKITDKSKQKGTEDSELLRLVKDGYGNYVIQKILEQLDDDDYAEFIGHLRPEIERSKRFIIPKHLIAVEKVMHRLDKPGTIHTPAQPKQNPIATPPSSSVPSAANSPAVDTVQKVVTKTYTPTSSLDSPTGA